MTRVLVTGGAGYIGSFSVERLLAEGLTPITVDNLSEGHREAVTGGPFELGDLGDEPFLDRVFAEHRPDAVMHFASRCYVGESVINPRRYYEENLGNALTLLRVMLRHGVRSFVLSSTCATYGDPISLPISESHPQNPVNPYGETKYFLERILTRYERAYGLCFVSLRYFNAAGAGLDGSLGESHDPETHLIPRVLQAALGRIEEIEVFGDNYATRDGTCIRDYIHVLDLASAHLAALRWLESGRKSDFFNLGTGVGFTIREILAEAEEVTGLPIPVRVGPARQGDPAELVADASKAFQRLRWKPVHSDLRTIIGTAWQWERNRRY